MSILEEIEKFIPPKKDIISNEKEIKLIYFPKKKKFEGRIKGNKTKIYHKDKNLYILGLKQLNPWAQEQLIKGAISIYDLCYYDVNAMYRDRYDDNGAYKNGASMIVTHEGKSIIIVFNRKT